LLLRSGPTGVQASRVRPVERIVADIGIEVEVIEIPDRICLQEPAKTRVVDTGFIIVQ
jgi:hypothetical protein